MRNTNPMAALGQRQQNADRNFIENAKDVHGIERDDAVKILDVYARMGVIKLDSIGGKWNFKHGGFFDKPVMLRALAQKNEQLQKAAEAMQRESESIRKTRFKELGYQHIAAKLWRILDITDKPAAVGPHYTTRTELMGDLERFAREFGCDHV